MVNNYSKDEEKTKFSWVNLKRMLYFMKPYKYKFIIAFLIGIIGSIVALLAPKIIEYAINVSFVNKDMDEIILLTLILMGIIIVYVFLRKIKNNMLFTNLDKVSHDLKIAIFSKLQYLPNTYFDTKSHGKIYTRATTYPDDASYIVGYVLLQAILDIINLIFVVIFMLITNVKLSLISIILSSILIIFFVLISPLKRRLQHVVNDKNSNVNAYLNESINGIRITQSFNREEKNESILKKLEKDKLQAIKKTLFLNNSTWSLTGVCELISMILIYYIGLKYFYPVIPLGTILVIDSYSSRFWEPIEYITSSYNDLMDAFTYLERIFELLDEDLVIENSKNAKSIDIKGNVEFKNVSFSYDNKKPVLSNVNIKIKKGEKIGLVGETGSGKSTILNLLSRFYDINSGEILIDGVNIKDINLSVLRGSVAMMLQDNFLFSRSVYDNLVLDKKIPLEEVISVCKSLEIHDSIMKLESGYDTVILNNGSNLSNGEKQLICMARIILQNPKIIVLDEATSNIDLMTESKLQKALDIMTKNRTTIMVAHRLSSIKNCDKIILIKNHTNYEEGSHEYLMKKKGEYYKLYSKSN